MADCCPCTARVFAGAGVYFDHAAVFDERGNPDLRATDAEGVFGLVGGRGTLDLRRDVFDRQFDDVGELHGEDFAIDATDFARAIFDEVDGHIADKLFRYFDLLVALGVHEHMAIVIGVEIVHRDFVEVDRFELFFRAESIGDILARFGAFQIGLQIGRSFSGFDVIHFLDHPNFAPPHQCLSTFIIAKFQCHIRSSPG